MADTNDTNWKIPVDALMSDDPLLRCLVILTRLYQHPYSAQTLTAGLPLEDGKLNPELFIRAANRAGLTSRVTKRELLDISALTFPVVLLLKNGNACVATARNEANVWTVIQTESDGGEMQISNEELAGFYSGFAIFSRPSFRFDSRAHEHETPKGEHWFWSVFRQSWSLYSEVLIASLLINIFALVTPLFTMNVYDRVVPNQAYETLWVLGIGILIVYIFDLIMKTLRAYFLDVAGKRVDIILSSTIFEKIMGLKAAVRPRSVGSLANNLQEFEMFRDFITSATITTLIDLPFTILFLLIILWIGGPVVLVPIAAIPIIILVALALQRPLQGVIQKSFRVGSQKHATLIETLTGLDTIKAVDAEGIAQRKWERIIGEQSDLGLKSKLLTTAIVNQSGLFQQLAYVGVVVVGVFLITNNMLTMGGLIACSMLTGRVTAPLAQVASLITRYYQARAAVQGVDDIMKLPVERTPGKNYIHRPVIRGDIEFRNVTFAYPDQSIPALKNVSFKISQGERVGIIGRIGSGKSTLEKLILGIYEPNEGSVWVDGVDLQQIDPADLRRNIGYIPQDVMLFFGSVKDNIVLGAPYVDDAMMLRAAEIAGVTEFVNRHPQGFDMQIGERGEGLSGGQRQSVANARALLLDPPIFIMDEPSNSLDNRSEENFKKRLAAHLGKHTLLLVTHRASLLTLVDRLIVMDNGQIIADGPKEQVMQALSGGKLHVAKG
ncbi:type I secretion system permease/ATPase [Oxalobacter formigenes]|uniref:type I secretion system permease/ATPase n=1 Tax=Oxalobacter formigenes TaxID=847 RepID=UPI00241FC50B|nr:type I secretion system permease/ATPase [Oxalobacter formigenes]